MKEKKQGLRRRKYDANFKTELLKMVANGQSVAYISQALGVSDNDGIINKSSTKQCNWVIVDDTIRK